MAVRIAQLPNAPLVGHPSTLSELLAARGALAVLRADPGFGGTRLLDEAERALAPGRSLRLGPAGAEPFGALRIAFTRAVAALGRTGSTSLPPERRTDLARLLSGEGLEMPAAESLVARWLAGPEGAHGERPARGAILVDDALEVDDPSLEAAVRAARATRRFPVIARIDRRAPLPPTLSRLEARAETKITALSDADAGELASSVAGRKLPLEMAARLAKRGDCVPLGVVEAYALGVDSGEWVPRRGGPARAGAEGSGPLAPKDWIERRLRFVSTAGCSVLRAVAVLGVGVEASLVHRLLDELGRASALAALGELGKAGWLTASPGFYTLPSRTHREVVWGAIAEGERRRWHIAASGILAQSGGKLTSAEAARHATLGGNDARAVQLALIAARAARDLGLTAVTEALLAFAGATSGDLGPHAAPSPRAPLHSAVPRNAAAELAPPNVVAAGSAGAGVLPRPPAAPRGRAPGDASVAPRAPAAGRTAPSAAVPAPRAAAAPPPAGELEVTRTKRTSTPSAASDYLVALSTLVHGEVAVALGALRDRAAVTQDGEPDSRARALLAYGIGLAAAGHHHEALLHALDALARAREAGGELGERACTHFLARLSHAAGHEDAAGKWLEASRSSSP